MRTTDERMTSSDDSGHSWVYAQYCERPLSEHEPDTARGAPTLGRAREDRAGHQHRVIWDSYANAAASFQRLVRFADRCEGFSDAELEGRAA